MSSRTATVALLKLICTPAATLNVALAARIFSKRVPGSGLCVSVLIVK